MKHHEPTSYKYVAALLYAKMLICEKLQRLHAWVHLRKLLDLPSSQKAILQCQGHSFSMSMVTVEHVFLRRFMIFSRTLPLVVTGLRGCMDTLVGEIDDP